MAFSLFFHFSIHDFLKDNISFNRYILFGNSASIINRIQKANLFLEMGVVFLVIFLFPDLLRIFKEKNGSFFLVTILLGLFSYPFSLFSSSQSHYLYDVYLPLMFVLAVNIDKIKFSRLVRIGALFVILAYINFRLIYSNLIMFIDDYRSSDIFSLKTDSDKELVSEVGKCQGRALINRAWVYLFSDLKPQYGLDPYTLYYQGFYIPPKIYPEKSLYVRWHEQLVSSKPGTCFVIADEMTKNFEPTFYTEELLNKSVQVHFFSGYQVREIK
jgi:hypothetical protein